MDDRWFLVMTKPGEERWAMYNLQLRGFTTYLPMIYSDIREKNSDVEVMFPRYLFLQDGELDFEKAKCAPGVSRIIRFGESAATVPHDFIQGMRCLEDEHGVHGAVRDYQKDDTVILLTGEFIDYKATVESNKDGRIRILIKAAFGSIPATVGRHQIKSLTA